MSWDALIGGIALPREDAAFPRLAAAARPVGASLPRAAFATLGQPQFQANAGSCGPHAFGAALEAEAKMRTGADVQLCRMDLYFGARWLAHQETVDAGIDPSLLSRWIRERGTVSEVLKPYAPNEVTTWRPPAEWADRRAKMTGDLATLPIAVPAVLEEIAAGRCVTVCHVVTRQMVDQAATTGLETGYDGTTLGGHARLVIGYDQDDPADPSGVAWILNWWKGWGVAHPRIGIDGRFAGFTQSVSRIPLARLVDPRWCYDLRRVARGLRVEV